MISAVFFASNGRRPLSISYNVVPKLKMSLRTSNRSPRVCSGDIYSTVPTIAPGVDIRLDVSASSGASTFASARDLPSCATTVRCAQVTRKTVDAASAKRIVRIARNESLDIETTPELLDRRDKKEDVAFRRVSVALEPDEIVAVVCRQLAVSPEDLRRSTRGSIARPLAAHLLCKYAGLTQRQVAETLRLGTGAAVSIQLKNFREALGGDHRLQQCLADAERELTPVLETAIAPGRPKK